MRYVVVIMTRGTVPDANFCIEECKRGTPERNAVFLAAESDYMLYNQTESPPYPRQLFKHINETNNNNAAIIKP